MNGVRGFLFALLLASLMAPVVVEASLTAAIKHYSETVSQAPKGDYPDDKLTTKSIEHLTYLTYFKDDQRVLPFLQKEMLNISLRPDCSTCYLVYPGSFFKQLRPSAIAGFNQLFNTLPKTSEDSKLLPRGQRYFVVLNELFSVVARVLQLDGYTQEYMTYLSNHFVELLTQLSLDQALLEEALIRFVGTHSISISEDIVKEFFKRKYAKNYLQKMDGAILRHLQKRLPSEHQLHIPEALGYWRFPRAKSYYVENYLRRPRDTFQEEISAILLAYLSEEKELVSLVRSRLINLLNMDKAALNQRFIIRPHPTEKENKESAVDAISMILSGLFDKSGLLHESTQETPMGQMVSQFNHSCHKAMLDRAIMKSCLWLKFASDLQNLAGAPDFEKSFLALSLDMQLDYASLAAAIHLFSLHHQVRLNQIGRPLLVKIKGEEYFSALAASFATSEIEMILKDLNKRVDKLGPNEVRPNAGIIIPYLLKYISQSDVLNSGIKKILKQGKPLQGSLKDNVELLMALQHSNDHEIQVLSMQYLRQILPADAYYSFELIMNALDAMYSKRMSQGAVVLPYTRVIEIFRLELRLSSREIQEFIDIHASRYWEYGSSQKYFYDFSIWYYVTYSHRDYRDFVFRTTEKFPKGEITKNVFMHLLWSRRDSLPGNMRDNLTNISDPSRVDTEFLREHLSEIRHQPSDILVIVYSLAFVSKDTKFQQAVVSELERMVSGRDPWFNRFSGRELKTFEARREHWREVISAFGREAASNAVFKKDKDSSIWKLHVAAVEALLSQDIFKEQNKSEAISTEFALVNGGYSKYSNYGVHESDLQAFLYGLFDEKALLDGRGHVINADGPGSPITHNAGKDRIEFRPALSAQGDDFDINIKTGIDLPSLRATEENVGLVVGKIAERKPERATLVYNGHGTDGLALWGGIYLMPSTLRQFYKKFSPETLVRSVFLQCFAANMLVSGRRTLPTSLELSEKFVDAYYPANQCGFAMSMHDEIGQYYGTAENWKENPWYALFRFGLRPSAKDLRDKLVEDANVRPTPMITSDYYIADIIHIICRDTTSETALAVRDKQSGIVNELCGGEAEREYKTAANEYVRVMNLVNDLTTQDLEWTRELIQTRYPEVHQKVHDYINSNDGYEHIVKNKTLPIVTHSPDYERLLAALPLVPEHQKFYDDKMQALIDEKKDIYSRYVSQFQKESKDRIIGKMHTAVSADMDEKQKVKRNIAKRLFPRRRELVESLFKEVPELRMFKERYEKITACEATPLN